MREIKFRAFDPIEGKMWEPIVRPDGELMSSNGIGGYVTHYQVPRDRLMQYTGLKDKNGVEIYEGDIDSELRVFTYSVVMGGWYLMRKGEGVQWHEQAVRQGMLPYEVIGNIYENPELLKE